MRVDGERRWVEYQALDLWEDDFGEIGEAFDAAHGVEVKRIAEADVRLFRQQALVDFAVAWMEANRDLRRSRSP